jgi:HAD superfamily hydrolase (TIGR01509 family)
MQLVCFDFDGTLVDSETYHAATWIEYLSSFGIIVEFPTFMAKYSGVTWEKVANDFIVRYRLRLTVVEMVSIMEEKTQTSFKIQPVQPKHGADELLKVMAQVCPVAVVTGAPRHYVESVIAQQGWRRWISLLVCGDDVQNNKPSPDVYRLACRLAGCSPKNAVAIEDSQTGMTSALSAGLFTLVVGESYDFWREKAHRCFDSLNDVQPYLLHRCIGYSSLIE